MHASATATLLQVYGLLRVLQREMETESWHLVLEPHEGNSGPFYHQNLLHRSTS